MAIWAQDNFILFHSYRSWQPVIGRLGEGRSIHSVKYGVSSLILRGIFTTNESRYPILMMYTRMAIVPATTLTSYPPILYVFRETTSLLIAKTSPWHGEASLNLLTRRVYTFTRFSMHIRLLGNYLAMKFIQAEQKSAGAFIVHFTSLANETRVVFHLEGERILFSRIIWRKSGFILGASCSGGGGSLTLIAYLFTHLRSFETTI